MIVDMSNSEFIIQPYDIQRKFHIRHPHTPDFEVRKYKEHSMTIGQRIPKGEAGLKSLLTHHRFHLKEFRCRAEL